MFLPCSVQSDIVTEFTPRFLPHSNVEENNFTPLGTTAPWHQTQAVSSLKSYI